MLGIDSRAARFTWTVLLIAVLVFGLYLIRHTLMIFIAAVLFAYLLWPLVDFFDNKLPMRRSRGPALAIVYLLLVGSLTVFILLVGSSVVEQATVLAGKVPEAIKKLEQPESVPLPQPISGVVKYRVLNALGAQIRQHQDEIMALLPKAGFKVIAFTASLAVFFIVPILSFFFLKDARPIREYILDNLVTVARRTLLKDILADLHLLLAQYIRALLTLSAATFVFYGLFFAIARVPYAILLATIAAPLEVIPIVGPLSAATIILLVAGFSGFSHWWIIALFLGAYRLFQDYVLTPHLMSAGVEIHPLLVIFGAFAGGQVGGVAGTFLSVPVMAALRIIFKHIERARAAEAFSPVSV